MPVLPQVVVRFLGACAGPIVDCTVGLGGHTKILLETNSEAHIIGLDYDEANLGTAGELLSGFGDRVKLVHANFADLEEVLKDQGIDRAGGILADLGVSSNQLADLGRGLSFDLDGPLDMRLDQRLPTTAADLVNTLPQGELSDLIYLQCQERHSRRIAKRICQVRRQGRINSTVMLARIVASAVGENPDAHRGRIHPATRTFMALRMAVNRETQSLERLLEAAPRVLSPGGRIAVISFHSVEDRMVKEDFKTRAAAGEYRILTPRPVTPDEDEAAANPRSRSAKLRVAEKLGIA